MDRGDGEKWETVLGVQTLPLHSTGGNLGAPSSKADPAEG